MKMLLLSLGLIVVCVCRGEPGAASGNLDPAKLSGDWYSILLASDHREKIEEGGSMRVFVEYIHALENSSLVFKFHTIINEQCTELFLVPDKTENDGEYYIYYDGNNTFSVPEVHYDEYVIFHLVNVNNEKTFQVMELYGRQKDLNETIKQKFVDLCQQHGIPEENIFDLTKTDRCLEARDGGQDPATSVE